LALYRFCILVLGGVCFSLAFFPITDVHIGVGRRTSLVSNSQASLGEQPEELIRKELLSESASSLPNNNSKTHGEGQAVMTYAWFSNQERDGRNAFQTDGNISVPSAFCSLRERNEKSSVAIENSTSRVAFVTGFCPFIIVTK
jgi:hypothetical protein